MVFNRRSDNAALVHVLLVDSSDADAELVTRALADCKDGTFELAAKHDLAQALESLKETRPDVIVTDLGLPDSSGLDTFEALHDAAPVTPVIVLTGNTDVEIALKAVDNGAQDYLIKGEIESSALGRMLLQAIARQRIRQRMADQVRALELGPSRPHNVVDLNLDGILVLDQDGRIFFANRQAKQLLGYPDGELLGQMFGRPVADDIGTTIRLLNKNREARRVHMGIQPTGWDEDDAFMVILTDVESHGRSAQMPGSDPVTGLLSRQMFFEQARNALAHARRNRVTPAMLCINLDNFRRINETIGHAAGDELLQLVGDRIRNSVRTGDLVGRFSADEFLILLSPVRRPTDAGKVAQNILDEIRRPLELRQSDLRIGGRAGIAMFPHDGGHVDALVRHAQVASQRPKEIGADNVEFYTAELTTRSERRFRMEQALRRALPEDRFALTYQPIVTMVTGKVQEVETLLRWQTTDAVPVTADDFIPVLEETGLIHQVGEWVLRTACQQARAWRDQGLDLRISVNLSSIQFESQRLLAAIQQALNDTGLPPDRLSIEITESALMRNIDASTSTLTALREMGIRVSIDDFGTGFSSLSYLKRFAIDTLKIDQSFIRDVPYDTNDTAITQATIQLAHALGLRVVAEGVELDSQVEFLRKHGCDAYQGFIFSAPVGAEEIPETVAASAK